MEGLQQWKERYISPIRHWTGSVVCHENYNTSSNQSDIDKLLSAFKYLLKLNICVHVYQFSGNVNFKIIFFIL